MAGLVTDALNRPSGMPAALRPLAGALLLLAWLPVAAASQATPVNLQQILGRWRGMSLCVKAPWNAACHDEQVIYHVARVASDSSRIALHADKQVGTAIVPMGDLECSFDRADNSWVAEFTNARGHVRWSFRPDRGRLSGTLTDVGAGRLLRNVTAARDSS